MTDTIPKHGDIEALDLVGGAKAAAYSLRVTFPKIKFTSGRRSRADQARAMAANVQANPKWIQQTYKASAVSEACQRWVDRSGGMFRDRTATTAGLLEVLEKFTDDQLLSLSKHFAGLAFDIKPVSGDMGDKIIARVRSMPGLVSFFPFTPGRNLVRWHAQFKA